MVIIRNAISLSVLALALSTRASHAGPCTQRIVDIRMEIDQREKGVAARGTTGVETPGATMHRQPTPMSVAKAEAQLGEPVSERHR